MILVLIVSGAIGCEGEEKATILEGLENGSTTVATSVIQAIFASLADKESSEQTETETTEETEE